MSVSVTDSGGTISINDNDAVYYIEKQKVDISTRGSNVIIRWDKNHYVSFPYSDFTAPSGASASAVASAIAAFLSTGAGAQSNSITVAYTIGIAGATGVDYNFTSVADALIQSIQMGASAIVPANSPITSIVTKCTEALAGSGSPTAINDVGNTSGGSEFISSLSLSSLNEISSVSAQVAAAAAASSVYFSITPSGNWSTLTAGKWKIWISYQNNSNN